MEGTTCGLSRLGYEAACQAPAAVDWINMVGTGEEWDHKAPIAEMLGLNDTTGYFTDLPGTNDAVSYEIWSNMHFGYVGLEAGFSEGFLDAGADLVDIWEHHATDLGDRKAIHMGYELYDKFRPAELTNRAIADVIFNHYPNLVETGKIRSR